VTMPIAHLNALLAFIEPLRMPGHLLPWRRLKGFPQREQTRS
jgi:hypothetical protein